jgi:hypothetical protein
VTWFKVDDSFYDHPKVFDAPDSAVALWVRAGTWSARNSQGGFVPTKMPARLCDDPEAAVRELLDRGLWKRTKGGYRFHDWETYQPTREEAIAAQQKQSSGGRLGNHRRWHVDKGVSAPDCPFCLGEPPSGTRSVPDRHTNRGTESGANPPSRPVPSRRDGDGSVGGHLQVADARENDGREKLCQTYGLTDDKAEQAMATISNLTKGPVKDWPSLLDHMAGNGTIAAIVDPLQKPTQQPAAAPARRTATGCDTHPDGAIDPVPPDGWGQCLICNTHRHRTQSNRRTA